MPAIRARRAAAAVLAACLLLTGCATARTAGEAPVPLPSPTETVSHLRGYAEAPAGPGAFVVRYDRTELRLEPGTYCYRGGCVDGVPDDGPDIGSPEEIVVFVPEAAFDELVVTQRAGEPCQGRTVAAEATALGGGWWSVRPRGPADDYVVDLFASGNGAGDMVASVRWRTAVDRPLPAAGATLALVVDHDGRPDSYGVELTVGDLTASPEEYSAVITTTAANGRSYTFTATPGSCSGEGSLFFDGPPADGLRAAALGDFPFTYTVALTLDGTTYTGTATYPDDLPAATEVAVPLTFSPALP